MPQDVLDWNAVIRKSDIVWGWELQKAFSTLSLSNFTPGSISRETLLLRHGFVLTGNT